MGRSALIAGTCFTVDIMAHAPEKTMTAEELFDLGDTGRCELIRGELIRMSPANPRHGVLAAFLCEVLSRHVRAKRLGLVMGADPGFKIGSDPDTVRAPDVAFVSRDRARELPERGYFEGAPDLAVEVVSPGDRWSEVQAKAQDWLAACCRLVWIVDPSTRCVTVYLQGGSSRVLKTDDDLDGGNVLAGFQISVCEIFEALSA